MKDETHSGSQGAFLAEFLRKPRVVGAVLPSSSALAECMLEWIDWPRAQSVVEYGPGTGVFTAAILKRLRPAAKFFAVEINRRFVALMRERFPSVRVYHESVENIEALCRYEGIEKLDAVISGLPWASFSPSQQQAYLDTMLRVLRPGGQFVTFAYLQGLLLSSGRRFRRLIQSRFSEVSTSRIIWRNLPPALVYRCRC